MTKQSSSDIGGLNVSWVPYVRAQQTAPPHSMIEKLVLRRIDGHRTIAQILELFPGQQEALQALSRLLQDGTLHVLADGRNDRGGSLEAAPSAEPLTPVPSATAAAQVTQAHTAPAQAAPVQIGAVQVSVPAVAATPPAASPHEQPLSEEVMQHFKTRLTPHTGPVSRLLLRDAYAAAGSEAE